MMCAKKLFILALAACSIVISGCKTTEKGCDNCCDLVCAESKCAKCKCSDCSCGDCKCMKTLCAERPSIKVNDSYIPWWN